MYKIITGMSNEYYDLIGKEMISSWLKFWPENFSLEIYTEDKLKIKNPRIRITSLDTMDSMYHEFQSTETKKFNERSKIFAKKAWPIMLNLNENEGKLIWVDADVITIGEITEDYLNSLIGPDDFSSHIGVYQSEYYSVETGFFIIDRTNKFKKMFLENYKNIYYNRDFSDMKKPFDGDVFGKVIRNLNLDPEFRFNELNKEIGRLSPFNRIFKDKMQHYKAKRKFERGL